MPTDHDPKLNPLAGSVSPDESRGRGDEREDLSGTTLGPYRLEAKLGQGGMGVVYRARDTRLDRDVALKVLPASVASDGQRRARFLREARSAAAASHPNIATVHDVGESDGRVWLAMELVEGATLRERLAAGALPVDEAVRIGRGIAAGLARAHERGIVHRDLKPENVMLTAGGAVKVLDFGVAKLRDPVSTDTALARQETETLEGRVLGTPGYMSPEQASARPVDQRTDVYALGVVLHEMLTGGLPGIGTGRLPIADARIEAIVARCMEASPERRWADAGQVLGALEGLGRVPATPGGATKRTSWLAVGALAVLLGAGVVAVRASGPSAPSAPQPSASAVAAPAVTTLADLPVPASTVAEAVSEYRAGMQLLRDDSWGNARRHFARAAQLDPAMAAAHLRTALAGESFGDRTSTMAEFGKAASLRAQLAPHERVLLDALEPVVGRAHPEPAEATRRLRAASVREPLDVELLTRLAEREETDPGSAAVTARRASELDPLDANAWELLGRAAAATGDLDESRRSFARCAAVSVESSDCLHWLADLDAAEGKCDAMEAEGRREADLDPTSGYEQVVVAMIARGKPEALVRDAQDRALATKPAEEQAVKRAALEARLASLRGQFDVASRALDDEERAVRRSPATTVDWSANVELLEARVSLLREVGDGSRVRAAAGDFVERVDALTQDAQVVSSPVWPWWAWSAAERPLDPERAAWTHRQLDEGVRLPSVWLSAWAEPASTPEQARAALEALAQDPRLVLPKGAEGVWTTLHADAITGHTFLVAGRAAEALPFLRRAVASCDVRASPFAHVLVELDLGHALEQSGDTKGACDAYEGVLERWGRAVPRSSSSDTARGAAKRLRCAR